MLTLQHKKLCTRLKPMAIGGSSLYERIQANYNIIGARFEKEELLHLVSAPSEVYLEEGAGTNIIQNTGIHTSQQVKVDIVNNLLNRIMLYGTQDFSYQDSVYITNVLHKLGIQDVNLFMEQVKNLKLQEENSVALQRLYQDNRTLLTKLFREQEAAASGQVSQSSGEEAGEENKSICYLHQEVLKRLQTARIYQEVSSLTQNTYMQPGNVAPKEYLLAEHEKLSREYYRQELKNTVLGTNTPLLWHRVNVYEEGDEITQEDNRTSVEERITSAVLLNLADNLYTLRKDAIEQNRQQWFQFQQSLFMTSKATIERVEAGLDRELLVREQNVRHENQVMLRSQVQEKELLERLVDHAGSEQIRQLQDRYFTRTERVHLEKENNTFEIEGYEEKVRELQKIVENRTQENQTELRSREEFYKQNRDSSHTDLKHTDHTLNTRELLEHLENQQHDERTHTHTDMVLRENEAHVKETENYEEKVRELQQTVENHTQENQTELRSREDLLKQIRDSFHTDQEHTEHITDTRELLERLSDQMHEERTHTHTDMVLRRDEVHTKETEGYEEEVRELVQNIENRTREENSRVQTREELREQSREFLHTDSSRTEKNTQTRELLERMESHEKTLLRQGDESGMVPSGQSVTAGSGEGLSIEPPTMEQAVSMNMQEITNEQVTVENQQAVLESLEQELIRINQQNIANYNKVMQIAKEKEKHQPTNIKIDRKLAMQDGIRALENPEEVVRTFLESPAKPAVKEETEENPIYAALPPKLKQVFRQIEERSSMQTNEVVRNQRTQAAMNLLVRDIEEVSAHQTQENVTKSELHEHQVKEEQLVHKLHENVTRQEAEVVHRQEAVRQSLNLIHKKQENQIDDELLESIREERRQHQETVQNIQQVVQQNQTVNEQQVNTTTRNLMVEQHQDINELVREGVRKELGTISDKVYNRIERRLETERKRRGY